MTLAKPSVKKCVLCESTATVQCNHLGGRHHLAWFTMPFCDRCHLLFHQMVERAGIDLRHTDDPIERIRRALAAITIAEWMLHEQLKNALSKPKEQPNENKEHDDPSTPDRERSKTTPSIS